MLKIQKLISQIDSVLEHITPNVWAMCSASFRSIFVFFPPEPNLFYSLITILPNRRFGGL
jgi:hypothetical protein